MAIKSILSRHRLAFIAALALVAVAVAIPATAFVIVPIFVRSSVVESVPTATRSAATPLAAGTSTPEIGSTPAVAGNATLSTGTLRRISVIHFGTGRVSILQAGGERFLRFENVEIAAAPAIHVYLSDRTDGSPGTFTDLGTLKATSGSFNYVIPATVDLARIKSVVAWCQQFTVTVTYAVLQSA
jgi:hypothetical protein